MIQGELKEYGRLLPIPLAIYGIGIDHWGIGLRPLRYNGQELKLFIISIPLIEQNFIMVLVKMPRLKTKDTQPLRNTGGRVSRNSID